MADVDQPLVSPVATDEVAVNTLAAQVGKKYALFNLCIGNIYVVVTIVEHVNGSIESVDINEPGHSCFLFSLE